MIPAAVRNFDDFESPTFPIYAPCMEYLLYLHLAYI